MKKFITAKLVLVLLAFGTVAFVAESCGASNKHACGTKHQKRQRHKRIKKGTTFMNNFQAVETTTTK